MANLITLFRILSVFPAVYFIFDNHNMSNIYAVTIMVLAGISDWLDGYAARKTDSVTEFGKIFDPLADRVFFITIGTALVVKEAVPLTAGIALIARDILMIMGFKMLDLKGRRQEINIFGKSTTFILFFSLIFVVAGVPYAIEIFWLSVFLNILSGMNYARLAFLGGNKKNDPEEAVS